ncbi:MAG: hypothetical protein AABY40_03795, partial [Nanoarchaeota archaeon]
MRLENIVKMIVPAVFTANTAYANEAKVATPTEIASVIMSNDSASDVTEGNKQDWDQQKRLIQDGYAVVLIEPIEAKPGYCEVGLDGFPQKYDLPADTREKDGELRKAELILNLGENNPENKFNFPCDLKAETPKKNQTAAMPIIPELPSLIL